jgi:hypothetical protein
MNRLKFSRLGKLTFVTLPLAVALFSQSAYADTVTINFDSVAVAPGSLLSGAPVTSYLGGYGLTLSGMLPGEAAYIFNASTTAWMDVPSLPNIFLVGGHPNIDTFTLNFATPVDNFSFDRVGNVAAYSPTGTIKGSWSATAYNASNVSLGSVGEGLFATYSDVPTLSFSLAVQGIDHIDFIGNSYGFAGNDLPNMDNITFTTPVSPVPEPETYAMLLAGLGLIGFMARRREDLTA